ncbi:ATP-binding protein [uncultured Bacteroides sp.]|jgi:predicted AAA+ superfamily ATPase|uniref:ATP-binding protein n=1 Tax=uncultured Bacteroides sp. TaxID=162156 RepID=UPI00280AA099|nr:ATP-binding protein [uncultured Bacteroides sp.]
MKLINRPIYTERIRPFIGKGIIKVLTGQRRVGKSCILMQLMEDIKKDNPQANIIYINMEHEEFRMIHNDSDLFLYLKDRMPLDKNNYLFIDEIQDIEGFENVLRSLQAKDSCDIFITGSNAKMLSGELATYLSGRYIEFHIHSLSYTEFLAFHQLDDNNQSLMLYLTYGGLPYLSRLQLTDELAFEYLRNIYATILLKDVIKREGIRNVDFLETLALYTADNIGSLFSANNISKYLKSQRIDISTTQVINYLKALNNAYLINRIGRIDIKGLKKFEVGDKYFFEDLGLRNCHIGFNLQRDIHKLLENAVYLHLSLLQYEIYTGQNEQQEIDFIGIKQGMKVYVQVTYLIVDEKTQKREFGNLMNIQDNYPKYVVSLDEFNRGSNVEGIHHLHLADFLKMNRL